MIFRRFNTGMVSFSDPATLVGGLTFSCSHTFAPDNSPCDQIDFYVGNTSTRPLFNLHTFFQHNGWTSDRVWGYDVVVAIGYNSLSNAIVDIPTSLFPWCIDYFGATDLDMPLAIELTPEFKFHKACLDCRRLNRRCQLSRVGDCNKCRDGTCLPNIELELEAHHNLVFKAIMLNRHALCPAFQHLLTIVGNANGYHNLGVNAAETTALAETIVVNGRLIEKEVFIRTKASATQLVRFINGRLTIVDEFNVGDRLRFAVSEKKSKAGFSANIPCFGIDNPIKAYSLLNSALESPGQLRFADVSIRDANLVVSTTRIMILAQYDSVESLWIMVGWI